MSSTRLLNVAIPLTVATVRVLPVVNPPGPVAATVIDAVLVGTTVPNESSTATCTGGAMATPATVVVGWTVNASWLAAPNTSM